MDGLCSSPLRQCLKIRHLFSRIPDDSMIRKKKSEAKGRNFLASRILSSSASQCPPPLDAFQATPFSARPSCLVSASPVSSSLRTKEPGPCPLSHSSFFIWDADLSLRYPCLNFHCLQDLSVVPTRKWALLLRTSWT